MGMTTHYAAAKWNAVTETRERPTSPEGDANWWAENSYCRPNGSRTNPMSGCVSQNSLYVTNEIKHVDCTLCLKKMKKNGICRRGCCIQ